MKSTPKRKEMEKIGFGLSKSEIETIEEDILRYSKERLGFSEKDAKETAKIMISSFIDKEKD